MIPLQTGPIPRPRPRRRRKWWPLWTVLFAFLIVGTCTRGVWGTSEDEARRALINAGYIEPELLESHKIVPVFFGCGEDDAAAYKFRAINPRNQEVTVTVCAGWPFKNHTVRS